MPTRRVLLVLHNHPDLLVGGVEIYTRDLYEALKRSTEFEPVLLARAGRPYTESDACHPDSPITMANRDPNQYLLYTDIGDFDRFYGRLSDHTPLSHFSRFLDSLRPDVVHFQHTAYLGYDIVRITRNSLLHVPILYSLHDYLPICHRDGQMVRTRSEDLCKEESPRRCHECFPGVTPQEFFLRKRFAKSHLSLVDRFIAPSEYVRERYVQWGLPAERIDVEPQGTVTPALTADAVEASVGGRAGPRNRFAYFGQLNPYKGADTLLRAMDLLGAHFDGHLWMHGANLDKQSAEWQARFGELAAVSRGNVTFVGSYERDHLAKLMARIDWVVVPSRWWETGPLIVWEAFQHGRPVICSDIGGQAEKVVDGVNGLQFRRGDPEALARALRRAAETPGLWEELREGIPERPGHPIDEHAANLARLYNQALSAYDHSREPMVHEAAHA
jgi:glycosyltransferase involved in cell wall biosynthesis